MYTLHEEVAVADTCLAFGECGAIDHHILTENVLIANNKASVSTSIVEVLWLCAKHCVLIYLVATSHLSATHDADVWEDDAVVAYFNTVLDVGKRIDCNVLANLCTRSYVCFITNHNNSIYKLRVTSYELFGFADCELR